MCNKLPGVKGSRQIPNLTATPVPQAGDSCSYTISGSTAFNQRDLTTKAVVWYDGFCLSDLENLWTQQLLGMGAQYSEADLPAKVLDQTIKVITQYTENMDWQGDTASASSYYKRYDGIIKIVSGASGLLTVSGSGVTAITQSTIRGIIQNCITKVPAPYKGNPAYKFFCGFDTYETYINKLQVDNLFHVNPQQTPTNYGEIGMEASVYTLIATHGLDGTNVLIGIDPSRNLWMGYDGSDTINTPNGEEAILWYERKDDKVYYRFRYRRGWQIGLPTEVCYYVGA